MKLFVVIFFIVYALSLSHGRPLEWPKFDLGMMLNKNIIGKESVQAKAIPGQSQTQTFTYNSVSSLQ